MIKRFRIKRLLRYYWVNLVKWANSGKYILVDEREQRGKSICLRLISNPNSELKICPETNKRYIVNKIENISIIINTESIDFFDDHLHTVKFCEKNYRAIVQVFDKHASADRQKLENKIRVNVKHSFDDMYDNLFEK